MSRTENGMKRCSKCQKTKPLVEYSVRAAALDGRQSYCRACQSAMQAARWAGLTPEQRQAEARRWNGHTQQKYRRLGWNAYKTAMKAVVERWASMPGPTSYHERAAAVRWALEEVEHEQAAEPIVTLSLADAELIRRVAQYGIGTWSRSQGERLAALDAIFRLGKAIGEVPHEQG